MIYLFTCGTCCAKIIYHNVDKSLWWFHSSETSLKELSKNTISFADPQLQLLPWNFTHFRPPIEKQFWRSDIVATTICCPIHFTNFPFLSGTWGFKKRTFTDVENSQGKDYIHRVGRHLLLYMYQGGFLRKIEGSLVIWSRKL